jgi:hypothetical protein
LSFFQPLKLVLATSAHKSSSDASKKTVQRRASAFELFRKNVSGGDGDNIQQLSELRRLGRHERQMIVREAGLNLEIPPGEGLAMKAELEIPWNKIRHMRRYVNLLGLTLIKSCHWLGWFSIKITK